MSERHLAKMIRESARRFGTGVAMRYKDADVWHEISYQALGEKVQVTAKALLELGVNEGDMIGIFSQNRPEWAVTDFGILCVKGVSVPLYATNTAGQTEFIVKDATIKIIFVGDQVQYDKVKTFSGQHPCVEKIIAFDSDIRLEGDDSLHFCDFLELGQKSTRDDEVDARLATAGSDDLATLIYTSGTTGDPKGVMLTHGNFLHQFDALDANFEVGPADISLCFLPLSHAYERTWSFYVFKSGAQNSYLANPKKVIEYLQEVRPTAMVSVPRLYEKIYSTVYDRLEKATPFKKKLFTWAIGVGKDYGYRRKDGTPIGLALQVSHLVADKLVLSKIRDIVGGPKNFFSAGGAALSQEIEEFFFAAGLLVCEGYGLTETAPMITYNCPSAFKFGTVGRPVPLCEVKIGEQGEILARGPNLMKGYFNKPEETAEVIVSGWLRTGDVGHIDDEGFVTITDRIKDLIITSGGKNIAPQRIETMVGKDHYIEQINAIGDGKKYISALIVPSFPAIEAYARENGIAFSSRQDLVQHPEIKELYRKRIETQSADLAGYEKIKTFTLIPNEFSQEGGELTPTLKIKRKVVMEKYKDIIDAMYPDD